MSWLQRVFSLMNNSLPPEIAAVSSYAISMATELSSQSELSSQLNLSGRSICQPERFSSVPLEYTGINGEYDPQGLAKRIAQAFDQHPQIRQIRTLCILQSGRKISLLGKVTSASQLQQVIAVAKQVNGVQEVDIDQVVIGQVGVNQTATARRLVPAQ